MSALPIIAEFLGESLPVVIQSQQVGLDLVPAESQHPEPPPDYGFAHGCLDHSIEIRYPHGPYGFAHGRLDAEVLPPINADEWRRAIEDIVMNEQVMYEEVLA